MLIILPPLFIPSRLVSSLHLLIYSLRPKKTVVLLQQRRKISLSISTTKRDRTGWLSYSQVDMPVSALPKSTNLSTTASAVVALCVSKRVRDPASSVETWYENLFSPSIFFYWNLHAVLAILILRFSILYWPFFLFFFSNSGLHKRGAGHPATRLQQKPETKKEAHGRWESKQIRIIKYKSVWNNNVFWYYGFVFILVTDCGERDYLPHQEAIMKAGLEKAVQHKDKLLEYDKNRYNKNTQSRKELQKNG